MPESRWNNIFALGLVFGGVLAIFALVWVFGLNYCPNHPCNYEQAASDPNEDGAGRIWQMPNAVRGTFSYETEPDYAKGAPARHEYYDLRAQERMAHATDWIVWISIVSSGIGVFGLAALVYTLNLQRGEFLASHPPFFKITQVDIDVESWAALGKPPIFPEEEPSSYNIYVTNAGGTDANFNVEFGFGNVVFFVGRAPPRSRPFWVDGREYSRSNPIPLKPNKIFKSGRSTIWEITEFGMVDNVDRVLKVGAEERLFMIGRIHYADARAVNRHTMFCRAYCPETKRFVHTDDPDYEYHT